MDYDILELWIFYIIHYFFYIIDIYIVITAEHPSHGVKGAFWMFPSPYNINLLIIYLFTYSYGVNLINKPINCLILVIKFFLDDRP